MLIKDRKSSTFYNRNFEEFLKEKDIKLCKSAMYYLQQNRIIERIVQWWKQKRIYYTQKIYLLLIAVNTAAYTLNRTLLSTNKSVTAYDMVSNLHMLSVCNAKLVRNTNTEARFQNKTILTEYQDDSDFQRCEKESRNHIDI